MRLKDLDLGRIVPDCMKDDACIKALNATLEPLVKELAVKARNLSVWDRLEKLTDEELDNIAYEFDIPWYSDEYPREVKAEVIRNSDPLLRRLGTPYMCRQTIQSIFGDCKLEESVIDYEGKPHYFRITVANGEELTETNYKRLLYLINKVKRASSRLEKLMSVYTSRMDEAVCMSACDVSIDKVQFDLNGYKVV